MDLVYAIESLEPFGTENKIPVFGIYGATLQRITPIGNNKHIRLLVSKDSTTVQCLLFGVTPEEFCFKTGDVLDLAVSVDKNYYKGEYNISVQVKALRMSGTDDNKLFDDLWLYNDWLAGKLVDFSLLLPSRAEVGEVYKFVNQEAVLPQRVKYVFINSLGLAKTSVAIKTLEELGLIALNDEGKLRAVNKGEKTNLLNSKTYRELSERSGA